MPFESVSLLAHIAPLLLLGGGHYLSAFTAEQLQANLHIFSNPENKTGGDTYARGSTNTPAGRPSPIKLVRTPKIAMIPTLSTHNTQSVEIVEMTVLVIYPSLTPPDWLRSVASRAQLPT
jgi:hypothetical protein